jgi:hypothetical protein
MDPMWFYDDAEELEELQMLRKQTQQVEQDYLGLRVALRDAEAALRADPENEDLKVRVEGLKKSLEEIEKQYPWLCSEVPVEILLWGAPHG